MDNSTNIMWNMYIKRLSLFIFIKKQNKLEYVHWINKIQSEGILSFVYDKVNDKPFKS